MYFMTGWLARLVTGVEFTVGVEAAVCLDWLPCGDTLSSSLPLGRPSSGIKPVRT